MLWQTLNPSSATPSVSYRCYCPLDRGLGGGLVIRGSTRWSSPTRAPVPACQSRRIVLRSARTSWSSFRASAAPAPPLMDFSDTHFQALPMLTADAVACRALISLDVLNNDRNLASYCLSSQSARSRNRRAMSVNPVCGMVFCLSGS